MSRKSILRSSALFIGMLFFVTGISSPVWAVDGLVPAPSSTPSPSPSVSASPSSSSGALSPDTVALDPDTLRKLMIQNNPSMISALNQVYQAKDVERVARNGLLPGANLSSIIGSSVGPAFILTAVEFLVPFLIPSNWFNYEASLQNFQAETLSYKIMELNTYASVYALYETVVQDENLLAVLKDQANDWSDVVFDLNHQNAVTGTVPQQDIQTAQAEFDSASAQIDAMESFIAGDVAQLRYALGLPLSAQIKVDPTSPQADLPKSAYEDLPIATNVTTALQKSPEIQQLKDLISAGGSTQWSDSFAWMNGLSYMAGNPYASQGQAAPDISSGQVRGNFAFGFQMFPEYSLDQDKIDAINISLNDEEIPQLTETLESTQNSLNLAKQQLAFQKDAEEQMSDSYFAEKFKYDQGQSNMENLVTIRNQLTQYAVARANALGQVDQLRITLERTLLENEFAELPGCQGKATPQPNLLQSIWDTIQSIFSSGADHATLDQVCRATSS